MIHFFKCVAYVMKQTDLKDNFEVRNSARQIAGQEAKKLLEGPMREEFKNTVSRILNENLQDIIKDTCTQEIGVLLQEKIQTEKTEQYLKSNMDKVLAEIDMRAISNGVTLKLIDRMVTKESRY